MEVFFFAVIYWHWRFYLIEIMFIGGSGLYELENLEQIEEVNIPTPFGETSDSIITGSVAGVKVGFMPRHGKKHTLLPNEIPYRANIYAIKTLGANRIVSVSAVGSLRENISPMDIVIPDQLIDRTASSSRGNTFFGDGIVAHVSFADPYCSDLRRIIRTCCQELDVNFHYGGDLVVIEGPQFSSRSESNLYRSWGADIIGMTALPEAKLAREAEMCYSTLAMVTDYDCWRSEKEEVSADLVIRNLKKNSLISKSLITLLCKNINTDEIFCACRKSLEKALITKLSFESASTKKIQPIIGKYIE